MGVLNCLRSSGDWLRYNLRGGLRELVGRKEGDSSTDKVGAWVQSRFVRRTPRGRLLFLVLIMDDTAACLRLGHSTFLAPEKTELIRITSVFEGRVISA